MNLNLSFATEKPVRKRTIGQSLVESTLVLLIFLAFLLGVVDVGQVAFAHETLESRVEMAVRWGSLHPNDGVNAVRNLIMYGQPQDPVKAMEPLQGLKPENIIVRFEGPSPENPEDEFLTVAIVNFESHLFSPWIARVLVSPRPVLVTAPVRFRQIPPPRDVRLEH